MILKALTLENFKGIREPVRVEFAPLTLLFGPNNAGKSTIVQALMYAREVLERNNCDVGTTELGGSIVDLGGFENIVHGRDLNRVIRMRFELNLTEKNLPVYSGWIEKNELDYHISDLGRGEEGFDVHAAQNLTSRLTEVWVEINISWDTEKGAHVSEYSVGTAASQYAKISLAEEQENGRSRALLSSFSYGTYPFGSTHKGRTEIYAPLIPTARKFVKDLLRKGRISDFQEGATVAMEGEDVKAGDNRMAWDQFDRLFDDVAAGHGVWGDSSVDPETGEKNFFYEIRQLWLKLQEFTLKQETPEAIEKRRESLRALFQDLGLKSGAEQSKADEDVAQRASSQEKSDEPSAVIGSNASATAPSESCENQGDPATLDLEGESGAEDDTCEDHEIESWFWDLLQILVKWEYIPRGRTHPLRVNLLDTALPEWGRKLDFDPRTWEEAQDPTGGDWQFYLVMGREYLKNLLTEIVVGPGERLKEALEQSVYLSPFREIPQRNFVAAHSPDSRRWCTGLAAWDRLVLEGEPLAIRVNEWLNGDNRLNSGYWVEVKRFKELDVDSELLQSLDSDMALRDLKPIREQINRLPEGRRLRIVGSNGTRFSPQDLGVGISQVIPVIVTALHNRSGVVAIEEPESNIHPAFQVVLGDLFLSQANANRNTTFLVETHSEHLILRIMRRMRETYHGKQQGELSVQPSDVSILFVEREADRTLVRPMPLNEVGELVKAWPGGFFEEGLREQFGDD